MGGRSKKGGARPTGARPAPAGPFTARAARAPRGGTVAVGVASATGASRSTRRARRRWAALPLLCGGDDGAGAVPAEDPGGRGGFDPVAILLAPWQLARRAPPPRPPAITTTAAATTTSVHHHPTRVLVGTLPDGGGGRGG